MRKSGLLAAALLSGLFAAGVAAQDSGRNALTPSLAAFATAQAESLTGNPLWAIALSELSETQARPLFSPSRRPPAPPALASLAAPLKKPGPPAKSEPDHPLLTLLGTIVGDSVEIGVFADEASHDVIRLRAGDVHDGWTLSSVVDRAAFFQKEGYRVAAFALPAPDAVPTGGNGRTAPVVISPFAGVAPANTFAPTPDPAAAKGGWRRPPKEG